MRLILTVLLSFLPLLAHAELRVAVIDTGLDNSVLKHPVKICPEGSFDYTRDGDPFTDPVGHGTNVSGLIQRYARGVSYCEIVLKFYDPSDTGNENLINSTLAFDRAVRYHADVINYSAGGTVPSWYERAIVERALDLGIKINVAAGNNGANLRDEPFFPACYDSRISVVESTDLKGRRLKSSDYLGKPSLTSFSAYHCYTSHLRREVGLNEGPETIDGAWLRMTGTSQATAVYTGKMIHNLGTREPQERTLQWSLTALLTSLL